MKKTLISILGILILILVCVSAAKGISVGKLSIYSINSIKAESLELDKKIEEANTEISQNYASSLSKAETASEKLISLKNEYESRVGTDGNLGITQIEKYKIEYLWGILGGYAKDRSVKAYLDFKETSIKDTYDITFTVYGSYLGITDFLYDIENDDELNYRAKNFKIEPSSTTSKTTTENEVTNTDTTVLIATFTVENVIVNFN